MKTHTLKNQIATMLNGKMEHFIKFYIKDKFYKQIRCDKIKPGMFLLNDTMILFCNLDQEDTVTIQDDKLTCDAMIKFLLDPKR